MLGLIWKSELPLFCLVTVALLLFELPRIAFNVFAKFEFIESSFDDWPKIFDNELEFPDFVVCTFDIEGITMEGRPLFELACLSLSYKLAAEVLLLRVPPPLFDF